MFDVMEDKRVTEQTIQSVAPESMIQGAWVKWRLKIEAWCEENTK